MSSPNTLIALLLSSLLVCTSCQGRYEEEASSPWATLAEAYVGAIAAIEKLAAEHGIQANRVIVERQGEYEPIEYEPVEYFLGKVYNSLDEKYRSGNKAQQTAWQKAGDAIKEAQSALGEAREEEEKAPYGVAVEHYRRATAAYYRAAEAIRKIQEAINEVKS